MIASIHQPNYIPWLGFFEKISKSDVFVILDDVQYPRGKSHFGHRNMIRTNTGSKYLTLPIVGKSSMLKYNEILLGGNGGWSIAHINLITTFYKKSPYFKDYSNGIFKLIMKDTNLLCDINVPLIKHLCEVLGISTKILMSSDLGVSGGGGDKIMNILKKIGATSYISGSGPGSVRHIDRSDFHKNSIKLIWQEYQHPTYRQMYYPFIENMTILDLIFNEGHKSLNILKT